MIYFTIIYLVIGFLFGLAGFMGAHEVVPETAGIPIVVGIIEMLFWPIVAVSIIAALVRK